MPAAGTWTSDGLLVASVFRDMRDPQAKPWSMSEHHRGMMLNDMSLAQEHFQGYFCRSQADDKYYAVAGHNHASVFEIVGLDKARRYRGTIDVGGQDILKAQRGTKNRKRPASICGRRWSIATGWKKPRSSMAGSTIGPRQRDDRRPHPLLPRLRRQPVVPGLSVAEMGPFKNSGEQWDRLFKTGACVDLHLGVDPEAPAEQVGPVPGDLRLLLAMPEAKPAAVLYRPVLSAGSKGQPWRVVSPVGEAIFDDVRQLTGVRLASAASGRLCQGYTVEAAIPLSELGLTPADGLRLKLDWGVLRSGPRRTRSAAAEVLGQSGHQHRGQRAERGPAASRAVGLRPLPRREPPSTEDRLPSDELTSKPAGKDKAVKADVDDILDSLDVKKE